MVKIERKPRRGAMIKGALLAALIGCSLSACASLTPEGGSLTGAAYRTPYAQGRHNYALAQPHGSAPHYKLGGPYQAGGVWYVPADRPDYDEVGLASWYGDAFNGKPTADGEMFDMNGVSAAHATLPLPCIVEVTNLDNGKSIPVRINDRGPFHPGRIIDLSRGGAKALGYYQKGTARVRVRFMALAPLGGVDPHLTVAAAEMHGLIPAEPEPFESPVNQPRAQDESAGFLIQVGAFTERANAERVAARVASAGQARIQPLDRNGGRLYRVTVGGGWRNAQSAGAARAEVAALGFADATVISGS
jgi:rare lipoprotein A